MCEININECDPSPCQNIATCIDGLNNFKCVCASGFEGNSSLLMLSGLYFCGDLWKEGIVRVFEVGLQTLHIAKNIVKGKQISVSRGAVVSTVIDKFPPYGCIHDSGRYFKLSFFANTASLGTYNE